MEDELEAAVTTQSKSTASDGFKRELLHLSISGISEDQKRKEALSNFGESKQISDQNNDGREMGQKKKDVNSSTVVVGHPVVEEESARVKKVGLLRRFFARLISLLPTKNRRKETDLMLPGESTPEVQTSLIVRDLGEDQDIQTPVIESLSEDMSVKEEPKSATDLISGSLESITEAKGSIEEAQSTEVIDEQQIILKDEIKEPLKKQGSPAQEYQRAISGAITVAPGATSNSRRWWELNNFSIGESTRDIEADFVKSETFVVAGMSIRGASHQENGAPNQDAFSITFAREYLVAAVSDGVSAAKLSGYGSRYMSTKVSRRIAIELDQQSSELNESDIQKIISGAISESAKSLMKWTTDSFDAPTVSAEGVSPQDMAATLTVAVIPNNTNSENQRKITLAFIGDSPCYILAENTWKIMTPATKEGLIVENSTSWVPGSVVGDVAPDFIVFNVRDEEVILLMTDGVSTSLGDGNYPVAQFLGPRLAQPQNMGDYFDSLNFDRRGEADDRTLVAIYSQTSIIGSKS